MKKISKRVSRIIGLVLAFAMMFSVGSVYAGDGNQPDEFSMRVGHMLGAVAKDAQGMGMRGVDFDNLYLGECALTENGVSFYPIFEGENGKQVATISTWLDKSGDGQLQFSAGVSKSLLARNAIISTNNMQKIYVVNTYTTTGKNLSVPVVAQGTGTNLCWAACVSSTGLYRNKPYKSPEQVAASIGYGNVMVELPIVQSALSASFQLSSTVVNGRLSIDTIVNSIDSDKPIITWMGIANPFGGQGMNHAVLVTGYVYNGYGMTHYITYMDPDGGGSNQMTSTTRNFEYTSYYSGNTPPYVLYESYGYLYLNS